MSRRKNIGSKNTDISQNCRDLDVKAYGEFRDGTFEGTDENGGTIIVKSKVIDAIEPRIEASVWPYPTYSDILFYCD
jgi:glutamine synthetase type III